MTDENHRVVREIELPASTDEVWEALTDPERIEGWFGATVEWELRPGGAVTFTGGPHDGAEGSDGRWTRTGRIDEVSPGRLLRFRWWPSGEHRPGDDDGNDDGVSAVRYDLDPVPGGTRLVVTETLLAVPSARLSAAPGATATSQQRGLAVCTPWDVRLVALWLGCRPGLLVRV